ncbi:MAG TPA: glycoside hydrolase family 3 N-terminal domain-containing protein [Cyclobacteriaceae bacterium]|nr:glycoside hydrolase family 3 N-terminal domain-containing protein [Cyclobacteriaceae bacterium]
MAYLRVTLIFLFASAAANAQNLFTTVQQQGGPTLGYSSGIQLIRQGTLYFKDLNRNGTLDKYEDWRLPVEERAKDLASKLSIDQIAGLMLYSAHQSIPAREAGFGMGTYNGKTLKESGLKSSDLSDQQKEFLSKDHLRHVLITTVESPEVAAMWNNNAQAFVESIGFGIPINTSSDPRHHAVASAEYNAGSGGKISMWPEPLGLAATFDPSLVEQFGSIAAKEYRALGITTALSPQVDLGTEPRWNRINGTFGEDPWLSADMGRAYIDGFQTSKGKDEIKDGWGYTSVNAMVKHWPGGGPEEGGKDGHFAYGKFAVYPGKHFKTQLIPFTEGAFKLKGETSTASAVMPYYTVSFGIDTVYHENVGNAYSKYIIDDLLRKQYKYDGVVCTDWGITRDEGQYLDEFRGRPWGVEKMDEVQRHYKAIMAGVDQFGGNNVAGPILEAYKIGVAEHGEAFMRKRFEESAVRLLRNMFRVGLFENPYLDPNVTKAVVGNPEFMKYGYEAQLKSLVLLKNKSNVLPLKGKPTVYVPKRTYPATRDWFGNVSPEKIQDPVCVELLRKYFNVTEDASKADYAIVFVDSPDSGTGYSREERLSGGNGYVPISLQYGQYTASNAREKSIAAGDPVRDPTILNRSYKGKTIVASNITDLQSILDTRKVMGRKPVIVVVNASSPMVFNEFETEVDGILISFGVQHQAILEVLTGREPSGLLPVTMPASMDVVETQLEDVPHDMQPHRDSEGNLYKFGFGMNWKGVIKDSRTAKYIREVVN